ncbi:hypothetical protein [Azohydromonas sediminis]|uniref:hypothetical protein n=1 Tax=Azohydromonas sediminis TaxID=2259674 RepID=UPI0013C30BE7|nr:hypothetical protein [Azohydromonas sediminis]
MHSPRVVSNPFALMTNPQAVVAAMEASDRLRALRRRVCRPLDRIGLGEGGAAADAADGWGNDPEPLADDDAPGA